VRSFRVAGVEAAGPEGVPPEGVEAERLAGFCMLGINCVPGTPPRLKLEDESGLAVTPPPPDAAPAGKSPPETPWIDAGPDVIAFSNAPRPDSTLLTASGETRGAALGSPTPGVVVPSSGACDTGGGP
jgi:hypothetical protein